MTDARPMLLIPVELRDALVKYLAKRRYDEVYQAIPALQALASAPVAPVRCPKPGCDFDAGHEAAHPCGRRIEDTRPPEVPERPLPVSPVKE